MRFISIIIYLLEFILKFIITALNPFKTNKKKTIGISFRVFFEKAGGVYVKFGQILSLRYDVFPQEICNELRGLLDNVPPVNAEIVRQVIENDLQNQLGNIFSEFDFSPLASASIGQVHKALLKTGEVVVVKVRRPGISEDINKDLNILIPLTRFLDFLPILNIKISPIAVEFSGWMEEELDYQNELKNLQFFRNFKSSIPKQLGIPLETKVPFVYKDLSTKNIIVMEFISGRTINEIVSIVKSDDVSKKNQIKEEGYNLKLIGKQLNLIFSRQIFVDGYFNADPHPANIIVNEKNELYFLDFGLMGRLSHKDRILNFRFGRSLSVLDLQTAKKSFKKLMDVSTVKDESKIDKSVENLIKRLEELRERVELSGNEMTFAEVSEKAMFDLLFMINSLGVQVPPQIAKALRAVLTSSSIVTSLNPDVTFSEATTDLGLISIAAMFINFSFLTEPKTAEKMLFKFIAMAEDLLLEI